MDTDTDEVQSIGRRRRHGGPIVGVVGGGEHRLDIDRRHEVARQRPLVGASQLFHAAAIDEHRLADQGGVATTVAIAVGLAHQVTVCTREATGQKGRDVGDLPSGKILAQDEGGLGIVDHVPHMEQCGTARLERSCMTPDQIRVDRPFAGLQRLAARFGGHAYDPHRHETYGIGLTLYGVQQFRYRGSLRASRARQVLVLHPDEMHDGHAGEGGAFAYRMLYLDPAVVSLALDGASPPFVAEAVAHDQTMAGVINEAFLDFPRPLEPLAVDAAVGRMAELLARRSDGSSRLQHPGPARSAVARARDFLIAESKRTVGSDELEKVSGLDRFTLARHFRMAFGTSPHRFLVGRRLMRAQSMIAEGFALSEAAAASGFADQSHLTRHFAARFGVTPGRWAALSRD